MKNMTSVIALSCVFAAASNLTVRAQSDEEDYAIKPSYLDALEWRNIGPWRGGRATAIAGHPDMPRFYVMGAVGGVFITKDGGINWEQVGTEDFKTASVGAVDIAPSDPNVIVVGMGESPVRGVASSHGDGVYKSTDGGKSWTHLGLEDSRHISTVKIHPHNPDIFWVAVQGAAYAPTEGRGVYMTTDGGATFEKVLYTDENTGAIDLQYDPNNPRILYAAMWDWQRTPWSIRSGGPGSAIWKSVDGGKSWEKLEEDLPEEMGKIGVAVSAAQPGRLWAVIEAKEKGGVYRSDDYGKSWSLVNSTRRVQARSWYYMHIFADPKDAETVYVQNAPMLKSIDGGKTFKPVAQSIHGDHHDLWINPDDPTILAGANDGGAAISFDGGNSWSSQYNQPTAQFYRVNVDNDFFYNVYGGQQDNSTVKISSFGLDGGIGRDDYMRVGGCESAHVAFDPDNPRYVYAGCYLGLITEFDTQTQTSRDIRVYPELAFGVAPKDRKYRFNWNAPILVSQHDPKVIFHAGNRLFRSSDRGQSWTAISPDLTKNTEETQGEGGFPITNEVSENYNTIMYVAESPHAAGILYAGTDDGLLHITRDGGESWTDVTPRGAGDGMVNAIEISPHDPATAYVAFTRYKYNDHRPLIFKTTDYGRRWENIGRNLPDDHWVRVVREDPARSDLLYAGTELGLFVSWNDGEDWQPLDAGDMPVIPITDINVHEDDLVVSTQGRGFWILDNISPLRAMSDDIQDADLHLFQPATAYQLRYDGMGNAGRGKNPPTDAMIYYTLSEEPDLEETELVLEIIDADGATVRTIKSDKEKGTKGGGSGSSYALPAKVGLNLAFWDYNHDPLEQELGGFVIAAGGDKKIDGRTAAPGAYTVRITMGETVVEQPLEVRFDPRISYDPAHLAEQQQLVAETEQMLTNFQQSVLALRKVKEQAELRSALAEKSDNEALKEAADAVVEAVKDWEDGVISSKREFFQDVLNWPDRLFSDLQFLYGTIDGAMPRVTQGMKDRFADVKDRYMDAMAARDAVIAGPVAEFNTLFQEKEEPGIAVPDVTVSR